MIRSLEVGVTLSALWLLLDALAPAGAPAGSLAASVTDDAGQPVADAVVSLTSVTGPAPTRRPAPAVMDQQDKEFVPHVLPVYVGASVRFPNRDNIRHHVYSFSAAKRFDLPLYIGTPAAPIVFDKPGVVALGCNIHDWMLGYIVVLATPHFAKTDGSGQARIGDLPAGRYEARVWHPRMRGPTEKTAKPITVQADGSAHVAFVVSLKPEWRPPRGPGRYEGAQGG